MPNSIETIKTYLTDNGGLQRPNRYKVQFLTPPPGVVSFNASDNNSFFANNVAFGARATDVTYDALSGYGFGRMVPKATRYIGGVMMTVPVTGNQWVLQYMNDWFDSLYGKGNNQFTPNSFSVPYYDDFVRPVTMKVSLLDNNGDPVIGGAYIFNEVYPIEQMPINLDMSIVDKFLTLQIIFNYRNYYISTD